jgi:acyl carrier protein
MGNPKPAKDLTYDEILSRVVKNLQRLLSCDPESIKPESMLFSDLHLDQLDNESLALRLEDEFDITEITDYECSKWVKVKDVVDSLAGLLGVTASS